VRGVRGLGEVNQSKLDEAAYRLAKVLLLRSGVDGVMPELVEKYLHLSTPRPTTLAGLYERILKSAQNSLVGSTPLSGSLQVECHNTKKGSGVLWLLLQSRREDGFLQTWRRRLPRLIASV
jgi:hypothetical protein